MLPKPKPEQVKTELGAIALCITSGVAFLTVAAFTRDKFGVWEWLGFTAGGLVWITLILLRFMKLHELGFDMAQQHKVIDKYREQADLLNTTILTQDKLLKTYIDLLDRSSGAAKDEPPDKELKKNNSNQDSDIGS